ncbi:MAG: hypothetical protein BMS9Abin29_0433 [Gemmatimonadota bacterium]|nr:MAG: hypothetical protein BMS9Abin29_0433 [Gemmatimonadota bacterium]
MNQPTRQPSSFVSELKRRRVPRVAIVYLAASFAAIEAADVVFPRLSLPDWTVTLVLALAMVGFPVAIGLAWAFDFSGGAVERTPSVGDGGAPSSWIGGRTVTATVALAILGVGLGAGWLIRPLGLGLGRADGAAAASGLHKIAVLPLQNANVGDPENAALALGIHDDLLTRLARIAAFRVISRTSVMEYANTDVAIPEIARELGADVVLEGGVQRAGNAVRINMQLIDGRTDEHLWAETFDRPYSLDELFAVQTEIADRVAEALETTLTPQEARAIADRPTSDTTAYRLWSEARQLDWSGDTTEEGIRAAIVRLERAVELDPEYAQAWAALATAHANLRWFFYDRSPERVEAARRAAETALSLAPEIAESHVAMGEYYYHGLLDYQPAVEAFQRALRIDPSSAIALQGLGSVRRRQGRIVEAYELFERQLELDPRNAGTLTLLAETALLLRRWDQSRARRQQAIEFQPDEPRIRGEMAWQLSLGGALPSEAAPHLAVIRRLRGEAWAEKAGVAWNFGDAEGLLAASSEVAAPIIKDDQFEFVPVSLWRGAAHRSLAQNREAERAFSEAVDLLEAHLEDHPEDARAWTSLGVARAGLGDRSGAREAANHGVELLPFEREAWRGAYRMLDLTIVHATLGDVEEAMAIVDRFVRLPTGDSFSPWRLRRHLLLAPLRADSRFAELMEIAERPIG